MKPDIAVFPDENRNSDRHNSFSFWAYFALGLALFWGPAQFLYATQGLTPTFTPTITPTYTATYTPTVMAVFPTNLPTYVPTEILVQLQPNVDIPTAMLALSTYGQPETTVGIDQNGIFPLALNSGVAVTNAVTLTQDPNCAPFVQAAQPNYYYYAQGCPVPTSSSDPYFTTGSYALSCGGTMVDPAWPLTMIGAPCAWATLSANLSCPAANPVTVAVIDTGVSSDSTATNHPDLPASIFVAGTNTVGGTSTIDDYGHGTHVTGIIAAQWNNAGGTNPCSNNTPPGAFNGGMAGVAGYPGLLKIMPVKSLDNTGAGTSLEIIHGINFAVANQARVINMSLGATSNDPMEQSAVLAAVDAGCLVVASAGNDTTIGGTLQPPRYPAAYSNATSFPKLAPGVVAVGAVDPTSNRAWYSNGGTGLSLMAPGGAGVTGFNPTQNIFSCMANCPIPAVTGSYAVFDPCDNNYGTDTGTSMAAPYVTGAAALMLALNPALPNYQIKTILQNTATDLYTPGWDAQSGYGLLNICAALTAAQSAVPSPTYTFQPTYTPTATPPTTPTFTPIPNLTPVFTPDPVGCTNKGQDFWVDFPSSINSMFPNPDKLILYVSCNTSTTGTVAIPGLGLTYPFSIPAGGGVTAIQVSFSAMLSVQSNGMGLGESMEQKGIHVTAGNDVEVSGLNDIQWTSDAYLGLPTSILGTNYIINTFANAFLSPSSYGDEFSIVATQNNTSVTIVPSVSFPYGSPTHSAGVAYTISLNQGDTYQLNVEGATSDLSGTTVSSNEPIAVFAGSFEQFIPSYETPAGNYIVEEMLPPNRWGRNFATVPFADRVKGDYFRVMASLPGTTVNVNGSPVASLGAGQFYETVFTTPSNIQANQPVAVMQFSQGASVASAGFGDPSMVTVPDINQWLSSYVEESGDTGYTTMKNFFNIVVPNALLTSPAGYPTSSSVVMDSAYLPSSDFISHPNMPGYSYAQIGVTSGKHTFSAPMPFGLIAYGFDTFDAYSYPGGMNLCPPPTSTPTPTPTPCCQGVNETFTPLTNTEGLAVVGNQVYVTDGSAGNKVVKVFNLTGGTPVETVTPGPGGVTIEAEGVAVDSYGDIYVADDTYDQVEVFNSNRSMVQTIGAGVFGSIPKDVMVTTQGVTTCLFVSIANGVIYQYNSTSSPAAGGFPSSASVTYTDNSGSVPTGMVVANSTLYVANNGNGQVVSFPVGTSSSSPATVLQNLSAPIGLAVDGAGKFYLTYGTSVQRYNSSWTLEQTCSGLGPVWEVGLDASGHIYVAQTGGGVTVLQNCVVEPTATNTPNGGGPDALRQREMGTGSFTPTSTPTITPTISPTPSPTLEPRTFQVVAAPNVSKNGEPVQFGVTLGQAAQVQLTLFSMTGEQVYQAMVQGNAGFNGISWNLQNLSGIPVASGLYIYRVEATDGSTVLNHVGKVVVIR